MIFQSPSYREVLKDVLLQKRENLSMTGLAGRIGVSVSFLSEVLNDKKSLSVELAFKIAVKLGFTDLEAQYFCLLVQLEHEKDPGFRNEILKRMDAIRGERVRGGFGQHFRAHLPSPRREGHFRADLRGNQQRQPHASHLRGANALQRSRPP